MKSLIPEPAKIDDRRTGLRRWRSGSRRVQSNSSEDLILISSDQKPMERYVLMTTKSALSGARRADVTGVVLEHHGNGPALPNARPKRQSQPPNLVIGWMSG
jgi:hypothetical protein